MEEASLLVPMQRIVSSIQIEDDLPPRTDVSLDKQIDQQRFDRLRVVPDLVIGCR